MGQGEEDILDIQDPFIPSMEEEDTVEVGHTTTIITATTLNKVLEVGEAMEAVLVGQIITIMVQRGSSVL
jgi:hypothetical protein